MASIDLVHARRRRHAAEARRTPAAPSDDVLGIPRPGPGQSLYAAPGLGLVVATPAEAKRRGYKRLGDGALCGRRPGPARPAADAGEPAERLSYMDHDGYLVVTTEAEARRLGYRACDPLAALPPPDPDDPPAPPPAALGPAVRILASTGTPIIDPRFGRVVFDLGTLAWAAPVPIRFDHGPRIGWATEVHVLGGELHAAGRLDPASAEAARVAADLAAGRPWQASVGASPGPVPIDRDGLTYRVNGKDLADPRGTAVLRGWWLDEVSVVARGGDPATWARLAT